LQYPQLTDIAWESIEMYRCNNSGCIALAQRLLEFALELSSGRRQRSVFELNYFLSFTLTIFKLEAALGALLKEGDQRKRNITYKNNHIRQACELMTD
jgi:hypothetical protein